MTHQRCSQQGCWLQTFIADGVDYPPLFCLGERVKNIYTNDQGVTFVDRGVVAGLVPNPAHWNKSGWVYWVKWLHLPSSPHLALPFCDEIHESDLQPDGGKDA